MEESTTTEAQSFFRKDKVEFSFPQLVYRQINRVNDLISSDLSKKFIRLGAKGVPEEVDRRMEAIKSIDVLDKMLLPKYNAFMKEAKGILEKDFEELEKKFHDDFEEWFGKARIDYRRKSKISLLLQYGEYDHGSPLYSIFLDKLLVIMENLYADLLQLLSDLDYLKGKAYGEDFNE